MVRTPFGKGRIVITFSILFALFLLPSIALAGPIDISSETIYVRSGFNEKWITESPESTDGEWRSFRPLKEGKRSIVLKELPFAPQRGFLSLKKYPPENFTFVAGFTLEEDDFPPNKIQAYHSSNIGENWAVYLNGHLLRSEIHLNEKGEIEKYRHLRNVLIPIDSHFLKVGKNVLAVRIIGDPTNIDSGFHRSVPFAIDDYEGLKKKRSESAALVLMFLYLFFGVYHVFVYRQRTEEKYNLFYGIFSILLFIYLFSRTHAVYLLVGDSTILHRIEYASLFALLPVVGAFLDQLLNGTYSKITKILSILYGVLIAVIIMPVPNSFAIDILRIWQVTVILPLIYCTAIRIGFAVFRYSQTIFTDFAGNIFPVKVIKVLKRTLTESTAGNLLIGTLIMLVCAIFDIFDSMFWSYEIVLSRYGFFVFMLGITFILANRFIAIHKTLEDERDLTQMELKIATDVQLSLLPTAPENLENWDIALSYIPKYGASGDCYDFYYKNKRLRGLSLFDVSGHGIAAALIAMITKPIAFRLFNRMENAPLDTLIQKINKNISVELSRLDHFISCILLRINEEKIEYVNVGHPDLLMKNSISKEVISVGYDEGRYRGELLGVNVSNVLPKVIKFSIEKDDVLLIYSDGIIDGANKENVRYGLDGLKDAFRKAPPGEAKQILDFILEDFFNFISFNDIHDDFTLIVARKK